MSARNALARLVARYGWTLVADDGRAVMPHHYVVADVILDSLTRETWKLGFRHCVEPAGDGWRCVDCGQGFVTWPSDAQACPGPARIPEET